MSDTDTPTTPGPAPFGVRLDAATLARLDALAGRIGRKRGGAAAVALAAGLDALDGLPVTAPPVGHPAPSSGPPAALDVDTLAAALAEYMGPMLADVHRRLDVLTATVSPPPLADGPRIDPATLQGVGGQVLMPLRQDPPELVPPRVTRTRESPPPPPADGPRIDPATLRGVGGERRQSAPERRDPAPREDAPGRRLADGLRAARDARGLTQRDAAAAARVPLATYQRAEQGKDVRESTRAALMAWIGEG